MTSRVRVGMIGTGFSAGAHIDALRRIPSVEVVAIAASSDAKATTAGKRFGIERTFGNYRELLAQDTIDAVHDCTPNHLHLAINQDAIRAGKHVLSEKPLALDTSETASLVEAAAGSPVVSGVCFNYRHYPLVREAKAMLEAGEVGAPHLIHGGYLQDWLLFPSDWNWRLDPAKGGASRAIADIGSHWMDLLQYITGHRIDEVFAVLDTMHEERQRPPDEVETFTRPGGDSLEPVWIETEDAATVVFRTDQGVRGTFTVSQVSPGWKNRLFFEIDAGTGSLSWDQEDPNRLRIGRRDEANAELPRDPSMLSPEAAALAHYPAGHQEGWPDALMNLFVDFYATVAARNASAGYQPSFATFEDAHRITQAVEAIVMSHRTGSWQTVGAVAGSVGKVPA
jgi:predicted dehydrogenase